MAVEKKIRFISGDVEMKQSSPTLRGLGFLVFAMFMASLAANLVAPLLPSLLAQYSLASAIQEKHTAYLTGSYLLAMFVSAPASGHLSDHMGRRPVLLAALAAFTISLYALSVSSLLTEIYASRILSGLGFGGLLPVVLAHVSEHSPQDKRAHRFAWIVTAIMTGSLAGPYLGGLATLPEVWTRLGMVMPLNSVLAPLLGAAVLSTLAWIGLVFIFHPQPRHQPEVSGRLLMKANIGSGALYMLFALSAFVMYGVGTFEIGLSTLARETLHLDPAQLGMMYAECALVMLAMQALFFTNLFKDFANRHLLVPAFMVAASGLLLFPAAVTHSRLAVVVALVAAGAGIVSPLISYRVSVLASGRLGRSFGLQSAASYIGQAIGSASTGVLVGLAPQLPYWLAAAVLTIAALWTVFRLRPSSFAMRHGFDRF